jgi:hypothetical protein
MSDKRMIVALGGGLGNQLFQYAHALSYFENSDISVDSEIFGTRKNQGGLPEIYDFNLEISPVIHRESVCSSKVFAKLASISLRAGISNLPLAVKKTLFISFAPFMKVCYWISTRTWLSIRISTNVGNSQIKPKPRGNLFIGYFQSFAWILRNEDSLAVLKSMSPREISTPVTHFINRARNRKILGLHVRLGDYRFEENIGLLPKSYYQEAGRVLPFSDYDEIWIFTNDIPGSKFVLPKIDARKTVWIPQNFTSAETLYLMTYCSDMVISNSTFSWWGAFLNRNNGARVVCPEVWFKKSPDPEDICPNHWIRIKSF